MAFRDTANGYTHTFNMENELASVVNNGSTTSFTYDAAGIRVKTVRPGGKTSYFPFPGYEEEVNGSTVTRRITYSIAGQAIALRVQIVSGSNTLYYLHSDHLGSTSLATSTSGVKIPGSDARYYPFGDWRTEPTANLTDRGFTGHLHNNLGNAPDDIGLVYMQARWYLPGLARFISADSIIPNPANPQSYNRYAYVENRPLNFSDPTGHCTGANTASQCLVDGGGSLPSTGALMALQAALVANMSLAMIHYFDQNPEAMWAVHDTLVQARQTLDGWMAAVSSSGNVNQAQNLSSLSGQVAGSPNDFDPNDGQNKQESSVRSHLRQSGWQERYGSTDSQIRSNLGIRGKVADFVGRDSNGRWLVAESKGSNIGHAVEQLQNTGNGLYNIEQSAVGNTQFRIYTNQNAFNRLMNPKLGSGGYHIDGQGYLGYFDDLMQWHYERVNDSLIQVLVAP